MSFSSEEFETGRGPVLQRRNFRLTTPPLLIAAYNKGVEFEWTDAASAQNLACHAVRFSEAVYAFADPKAIEFLDERCSQLSLIGRTPRGLLYVVFAETTEGRVRILHARVADSVAAQPPFEPEFEFDARRMKRVPRPGRHLATPGDVLARQCHVSVTLELDAEVAAAFRDRSVNEALRQVLHREDSEERAGDDALMQRGTRRALPPLKVSPPIQAR